MPAKAPPNKSKSAKKRVRQTKKITERNHAIKQRLKTLIKKIEMDVSNKNIDGVKASVNKVISAIDSAVTKGVIHRNTASRKVSRVTNLVNSLFQPGAG